MWILYDFETSSKHLIGQIISYGFWIVDEKWNPIDRLVGTVKLKATEFPDLDAILITNTSISSIQKTGVSECDAALEIYKFLSQAVQKYGHCTLAGYNSNRFDLKYLRTTLIRYGLNPYFMGKITMIDILHFVQDIAIAHPNEFPWVKGPADYWTFSLESVAHRHHVLDTTQKHEAEADVLLMRNLILTLETTYDMSLREFRPTRLPYNTRIDTDYTLFQQLVKAVPPSKIDHQYWYRILYSKSDVIVADIRKYIEWKTLNPFTIPSLTEFLELIRYVNCNTHYFSTSPVDFDTQKKLSPICDEIETIKTELGLTRDVYFASIQKPWDIEFQIHTMGFERIVTLHTLINVITSNPDEYATTVNRYWKQNHSEKDRAMIQLLNRWALNTLTNLPDGLADRYLIPRYFDSTKSGFSPEPLETIPSQLDRARLLTSDPTVNLDVLNEYIQYGDEFVRRFSLARFF